MKQKIILLKGLPGSGKTTWAKELLKKEPSKWKRINKDDLRAMLDGGTWSKDNEKFILDVRDQLVLNAIRKGFNVIIDDTNLHPKHWQHIETLIQEAYFKKDVKLELKDFTDVPLEECLDRDYKREGRTRVGKKVIMQMYNQFLRKNPPVIEYNNNLPCAFIFDIDGTLALFGKKNPYERDFINDIPNQPVITILERLISREDKPLIFLVSGRSSKFLEETKKWLKKNSINYSKIFMPREVDDNRKDVIIKTEIYEKEFKGKFNIEAVFDDRPQVIKMWRDFGLFVFDCGLGIDF